MAGGAADDIRASANRPIVGEGDKLPHHIQDKIEADHEGEGREKDEKETECRWMEYELIENSMSKIKSRQFYTD